ncbi:MAG: MerR [Pseudonocardiaceae bacterium]
MTTYDVTVSREDELWVADIAGMTAATDVLRFADLDIEVRDLIAGLTGADPDGFEIRWHHQAGDDDVSALISELTEVEAAAETAIARRDAVRLEIIRRFSAAGLSQRVIADVLGLSHQRVHQLANAS